MIWKPNKITVDQDTQDNNRRWWTDFPMNYDNLAKDPLGLQEGTEEFFDEIDSRFFGQSVLHGGTPPFSKLIPFDSLNGKRVLEIGCGMGSHAQMLTEAGCLLTAIDLTSRAVELTRKRLAIRGLSSDVRVMDAEQMEFEDEEFDFIWSWGVIHHSAHPDRIMREACRVLKPSGEIRMMVYYRRALMAYIDIVRGVCTGKLFKGMNLDDILSYYTDGFTARFYTRAELSSVLKKSGFRDVTTSVMGQMTDLVPIPKKLIGDKLKSRLIRNIPDGVADSLLSRIGSFLFAVAVKGSGKG
ncbi:class I SAM-dependent methyltransferase [Nitrospinota bacterium]